MIAHSSSTIPKGRNKWGLSRQNHREAPARNGWDRCSRRNNTSPSNKKIDTCPASKQTSAGANEYPKQWIRLFGWPCMDQTIRTEATRAESRRSNQSQSAIVGPRKPSGSTNSRAGGGFHIIRTGRPEG